jgi:hypothetical protein
MPLGNGALTVSAWANVSAGGISAYIGHQGAMSSHCELFKIALLTLSLSPSPFAQGLVDDLMLAEMHATLRLPGAVVTERWMGTYASLPDRLMVRDAPDPAIRLVIVTSGTGASTAFAIAEETIAELFGAAA